MEIVCMDMLKKTAKFILKLAFSMIGLSFLFILIFFGLMKFLEFVHVKDLTKKDLSEVPYNNLFYVIVEDSNTKEVIQLRLISLESEYTKRRLPKSFTYLLSEKKGEINRRSENWKYSVEESETGKEQIITVYYNGDRYTSKSIYRVQNGKISPVYLKPKSIDFMFQSLFLTFILFVVFILFLSVSSFNKWRKGIAGRDISLKMSSFRMTKNSFIGLGVICLLILLKFWSDHQSESFKRRLTIERARKSVPETTRKNTVLCSTNADTGISQNECTPPASSRHH